MEPVYRPQRAGDWSGARLQARKKSFLSPACTQLAWTCTCTRVRSWPPSSFHANVELASQSARRLAHFHLDKVDIVITLSSRSQPKKDAEPMLLRIRTC